MELQNLPKSKGIRRKRKRLGIGPGSGRGKTSGKGHKGQKARSGAKIKPSFEGGQTPLHRKLPYKRGRGFTNCKFKKAYAPVNLEDLNALEIAEITRDELVKAGLLRASESLFKVLACGEVSKPLTLHVHAISAVARAKVEAAGGTVHLVEH